MIQGPRMPVSKPRPGRPGGWVVALVALVGLASSVGSAAQVRADAVRARDAELEVRAERARSTVTAAVGSAAAAVLSVRNLFSMRDEVEGRDFVEYVALQRRDGIVTGAQGVGFARLVLPADEAQYVADVRAGISAETGGSGDFEIRPERRGGPDRVVVEYVQPYEGNHEVLGFDLGSDPARREAIEQARDLGEVAATMPIALVQDAEGPRSPSFLMAAPVYDTAEIPVTAPARRRHFVGVVLSAYRVHEMLDMALSDDVSLEIYDVGSTVVAPREGLSEVDLLFDSDGESARGAFGLVPDGLHTTVDIDVGGRRWRLLVSPGPGFDGRLGSEPLWVLAVGLLATLFASVAIWTLTGARRRAEVRAAARSREARSAEERFRVMVERSPDPTLVVGADGNIRFASDGALDLLGVPSSQLIGSAVEQFLPGLSVADSRTGASQSMELDGRTLDGAHIPLALTVSELPTGETIVSARDVTTQRAARRALEEADEAKTQFLGMISHELRTPLAAIRGFTEMLLEGEVGPNDQQSREMLERVDRNAAHLGQLIEDVLSFSRLERRDVSLVSEPIELGQLVRRIVDQLASTMAEHRTEVDVDPVQVLVDPDAITRIVTNLLTNAARYSPDGSTIRVMVREAAGTAVITIDDEGSGVPAAERPRIFERFFRGTAAGASRGTGVGLTIVKELVEMSEGNVGVAESPSGGARFEVRIPAMP